MMSRIPSQNWINWRQDDNFLILWDYHPSEQVILVIFQISEMQLSIKRYLSDGIKTPEQFLIKKLGIPSSPQVVPFSQLRDRCSNIVFRKLNTITLILVIIINQDQTIHIARSKYIFKKPWQIHKLFRKDHTLFHFSRKPRSVCLQSRSKKMFIFSRTDFKFY